MSLAGRQDVFEGDIGKRVLIEGGRTGWINRYKLGMVVRDAGDRPCNMGMALRECSEFVDRAFYGCIHASLNNVSGRGSENNAR